MGELFDDDFDVRIRSIEATVASGGSAIAYYHFALAQALLDLDLVHPGLREEFLRDLDQAAKEFLEAPMPKNPLDDTGREFFLNLIGGFHEIVDALHRKPDQGFG